MVHQADPCVRIPIRFRGAAEETYYHRAEVESHPAMKPERDSTLVKALARAWRWQRMFDDRRLHHD